MHTRSQSRNSNRQQQQVPPTFVEPFNLVKPIENQAPPVVMMDDNRTMAQLLEASTEGYEDAIVVPEITADNFKLKHGLLTLLLRVSCYDTSMTGDNGSEQSNNFVDDLIELSGKTDPNEYLKLFVTQQIADRRGFIARIGSEVNIARNELRQLNALIAGLEASEDVGEVWDTIMCLRDEQRKAEAKLADLQHWLTDAEEEIVEKQKQLNIMDTQAIDDQAHLANYDSDNEIENDDLGYHSEEYFDDAHEDYENNHSNRNVENSVE
ncbi:hypothetical protein Tco_0047382 [Tanacetum coccineum]